MEEVKKGNNQERMLELSDLKMYVSGATIKIQDG